MLARREGFALMPGRQQDAIYFVPIVVAEIPDFHLGPPDVAVC